jgi:RluA family pseudouridine synthase
VRVVFEDHDLIVTDKPAGLLTIATYTEKRRTLYALLRQHVRLRSTRARVFIVHRLDREASGLLVFAKTTAAQHHLQQQFRRREAGRVYLALVEGHVRPDVLTLRSRLAENAAHRVYATRSATAGRPAVTHARVLRRLPGRTLLEVTLETGRKHQIRVQLADAGHPVLGDGRYGSAARSSRRLALHATSLSFHHPGTGKRVSFRSDPLWSVALRAGPTRRDAGPP